jgi:uncharacterized protein (UPF0548 family)
VINEPKVRGFAYGTLPGHPESGEGRFLLEQHSDRTITIAITPAAAATRSASKRATTVLQ